MKSVLLLLSDPQMTRDGYTRACNPNTENLTKPTSKTE
jgi:hypothetical protein